MSVTTTTRTQPSVGGVVKDPSLEETLRDYTLHLSSSTPTSRAPLQDPLLVVPLRNQPANWPTQYRRIPPYRPINHNLDLSERPNGSSTAELIFVTVMLNGVRLQSGLVRAWECTGARWYPELTRYKIGGEW